MFKWKRLGKIFDPRDHQSASWMHEFAQSPSALIFENHVRVYFCSRPAPTPDGCYQSYLSYIDLDRRNLLRIVNICQQPALSLGKLGTFDEFGTNPVSVIRDGHQIRVYYAGWSRCVSVPFNAAIGVAVSTNDGDNFSRLGDGPVLSYSPDEPFLLGSPRIRKFNGQWHLWYVAGKTWLKDEERNHQKNAGKPEPVYKIRTASSPDGLNWTKLGKDLIDNRLGENECQACPDVSFHDGTYHMFFSYRYSHNYKSKEGAYRIGYASSTDLTNWTRCDEAAGFDVTASAGDSDWDLGWDSESVSYPNLFALDGQTYMLYQGNDMGRSGIGLAQLSNDPCES